MRDRSASSILLGYFYQFDKTILGLLNLDSENESVVVEGIEDIDIETATEKTAVQCKYYESQEYFPSRIRKPLCLMLDDFVTRQVPIQYVLYAHFKEIKSEATHITLEILKQILTFKEGKKRVQYHVQKGIPDAQLQSFLDHFTFEIGSSYDEQHEELIEELKNEFSCTKDEVENYYYNNALRYIHDHVIRKEREERRIIKDEFIRGINHKHFLFNEWYFQLKSKKNYMKFVKSEIRSSCALHQQRTRSVFISYVVLQRESPQLPIAYFIRNIIERYFKFGVSLCDAQPWSIILDASMETINDVKKHLLEMGIVFNDGFESIKFIPQIFNSSPFIYKKRIGNNRYNDKIDEASFQVRLISYATYKENMKRISIPDSIFSVSMADCDFKEHIEESKSQVFHLTNLESLSDLSDLLT